MNKKLVTSSDEDLEAQETIKAQNDIKKAFLEFESEIAVIDQEIKGLESKIKLKEIRERLAKIDETKQ